MCLLNLPEKQWIFCAHVAVLRKKKGGQKRKKEFTHGRYVSKYGKKVESLQNLLLVKEEKLIECLQSALGLLSKQMLIYLSRI